MISAYGFCPLINKPTRITSRTATLIDNILTNNDTHQISAGILYTDISDHLPLFQTTPFCFHQKQSSDKTYTTRPINSFTLNAFRSDLECTDWTGVFHSSDVDLAYNYFLSTFTDLYNHHFPLVTKSAVKVKQKQPWISQAIITSINHKNNLYKRFLRNPSTTNEHNFKCFRNRLTTIIRVAKRTHYARKLDANKNNIKNTWREISDILGKNRKVDIPEEVTDGQQTFSSPCDVANSFNTYFTNIGSSLSSKISPTQALFSDYLPTPNNHSFFLVPTNRFEINEVCKQLNNGVSCGFDGISSTVVKSVISFISWPLAHIFNLSFMCASVPSQLKTARVTPIFKSGDRHDLRNYRPISVLPCFSKILEKLVYKRLFKFLSDFHLLYDLQFGFCSKFSTDMALIKLVDHLNNSFTEKMSTIGVFIDLSKAFDTIDHSILLSKLDHYGVRGVANQWFASYLSDRKQYTVFKNCDSPLKTIDCGVPQGSILGPLLFLLYVNDLYHCSSVLSFILFADDTTILFSHSNISSLSNIINRELSLASSWFRSNKLSLNSSKTKYMFFSRTRNANDNFTISINDNPIEQVHSTKFLGVLIDDKLTWKDHISSVSKIVSRNTSVLSKLRSFLPTHTLLSLYNTLILPYLNYCNIVWAHSSTSKLHSLFLIQKRAIRIASMSHRRDHTAPLFANLNTLTLTDINKLQTAIFMFKYTKNLLPHTFSNYFPSVSNTHLYNTRSCNNLYIPFARTSYTMNTLRYHGPRLWNSIDRRIRSQSSVGRFKASFKKHIVSHYVT